MTEKQILKEIERLNDYIETCEDLAEIASARDMIWYLVCHLNDPAPSE